MSEINQRIKYVDVLRGIAILFVVLGHNPFIADLPDKVFNVIFSFHLLLFYFASGFVFNPDTSGTILCKKRFNSLLKPYIFTVGVISLIYIIVKKSPSPGWYLFWDCYANGPNLPKACFHLWFLPSLFLVTMLTWLLFRYLKRLKTSTILQLVMIFSLLICGVLGIKFFWNIKIPSEVINLFIADGNKFLLSGLLKNPAYSRELLLNDGQFIIKGLPWSIDIVLVATAYFMGGYFINKNNHENILYKRGVVILMFAIFCTLHFYFNCTIDFNMRRYDNILLSTLMACAAIYICSYSAIKIAEKKSKLSSVLEYFGKYSLIIFIFHPAIQGNTYHIIETMTPNKTKALAFIISFIAGTGIPLLMNWLIFKRYNFFRYWYYSK